MERTLAEFARSDAPPAARAEVARALAAAVAELAARRKVHGGLGPDAVAVLDGGAVVLRPAVAASPLARAGFDAPEVARGGRPTPRSDAFSVGALAWLALAGGGPFDAGEPLEAVRRVLHAEPGPVRLLAPGVSAEVEGALAALLEKRPRRRGHVAELVRALSPAPPTPTPNSTSTLTSTSTPIPTSTPRSPLPSPPRSGGEGQGVGAARLLRRRVATFSRRAAPALARSARSLAPILARALAAARSLPPLPRTGLALLPIVAVSLAVLPRTDASLARSVASLLERGEVARARALVEDAARRRPSDPVVEKLRGDVACARGAPGECLRRYRIAIAARAELREDPSLRANARRLLDREGSCGTRRAAAQLLGELRDRAALPALEEARRNAGLFAVFCTGDAIDRAIAATRADLP